MSEPPTRPPNRLARRDQRLPAPAHAQPGRLVSRGARRRSRRRAREDKPLLVSIGYSACHWCHVMERESFEDAATAALMNELFVCDQGRPRGAARRRPDLHGHRACVSRGHGGWPLTVFCTPDGRPFYGGTYFPPEPRHGHALVPPRCCAAWRAAWREQRGEVEQSAARSSRRSRERPRGVAQALPGADSRCARRRARCCSAPTASTAASAARPSSRRRRNLELLLAARRRAARARSRARRARPSSPSPAARWRGAASTTSSAAASTATASTRTGACRTSRRCSTTRASSCASTPRRGGAAAPRDDDLAVADPRDRGVPAPRDARARRRLLREPGRRQRGRGGQVLRLDARRRSTRCSARSAAPRSARPTA